MKKLDIQGMKVLSVDDNENNLLMIEVYSKRLDLDIDSFTNPKEALDFAKDKFYDIVILDYMMPQMDGVQFITDFRAFDLETPIIMVTAAGEDNNLQLKALQAGATDFLTKPLNGAIFQARVKNLLKLKKSLILLASESELLNHEVEQATERIKEQEIEALNTLGKISEFRDPETNEHVLRVANYSKIIAKAYGISDKMQDIIYNAAPFHDIGKVGIPDKVLLKSDKLDTEEWAVMQSHSSIGYQLLKNSQSPYLRAGAVIAYTHHEKFDGSGYPEGLKGDEISILGRIVAIADVFDALCSERPYKAAWSFEDAFDYIISQSGTYFDPSCVESFVQNKTKIKEIYNCDKGE